MKDWNELKTIIDNTCTDREVYLVVVNENGQIIYVNNHMQESLQLPASSDDPLNFFHLLHPDGISLLKEGFRHSRKHNTPFATELYVKNGYYHPMKWQVNYVGEANRPEDSYLCIGYHLVDAERLEKFNQLGEKNYQLIVEGLNAGIIFHDQQGELIAANKKAAEVFGTTLERLYQLKNIGSLWNTWTVLNEQGEKISFQDTPFMKAVASNSPQSQVLVITLSNGQEKSLLFNSQPLIEAGIETPYAVVSNIIDVSLEKQLHSEVMERDVLFRAFLDMTPNLAWLVDEDTNLQLASSSFYEYFALTPKAAVGKNIFELIPSAVGDSLYKYHIKVLETGKSIDTLVKVKWSDGSQFIFHVNIFPINGVPGRKMLGGHAVNLADKYAVEKKLREANERLLLLTRAASNAIWEWDMQTGHIFRNETLMEMIGFQQEDTRGLSWWLRRIHPDDRNRVTDKIKEATDRGQQSWEDEYRFKCFDGTYKHIQDRGFVVYENGLPVKMIGSLQDITELKQLENQLTQEKLQRQKEISETVIRVQEKERTRLGHELHDNVNQILSTTKMFVEMLKPSSAEEIKIRDKSVEYLLTAIEEIRKLSKELVIPHLKDKGLVESIYNLVDDIQLSGKLKINFVHDQENDLLSPGKKVTIFRMVQEQLKNILNYSKADQVDISLTCKDDSVHLVIRDNGIGFDPRRTHRGIGLSNIHDRAMFYNGFVAIHSAPGKGCEIQVSIPLLQ
jgi:PAS domain S-box-containing protein